MVLRTNVPVHRLRVLATHVAVRTLEARQVDALQPVMPIHAAGGVEGARTPGTGEAPVQGGRMMELRPWVP